jgi:ribosome-associated translation inhibitor RaiA
MISIRVHGIELTDELRKEVKRSVAFAVDRYDRQLHDVTVYLTDLNGPKGGVDKLCQITANLSRGNAVLILEKGTGILPTVNRAAHRLGPRVGRNIQRRNRPQMRRFRDSIRVA